MDVLSAGDMLGTHVEETSGAYISAEEIAQRTMTVLTSSVESAAAKLAVITPATAPAPSRASRVWSLATGHATTMPAQLYVVLPALDCPVIYGAIVFWLVVTVVLLFVESLAKSRHALLAPRIMSSLKWSISSCKAHSVM